jgi:hypothetical protein
MAALSAGACSGGSRAEPGEVGLDVGDFDAFVSPAEAEPAEVAPAESVVEIVPDSYDVPDGEPVAPAWELPPCYRACDRVTACGVAACAGYEWANAGTLFEGCFGGCDEGFAGEVLAAADCPAVLAMAGTAWVEYDAGCTSNPCDAACEVFAACVVEVCEALEPALQGTLASDCHAWCTPSASVWLGETPCPDLVAGLEQGDPSFGPACHGAPGTCPGADLCEPWGAKVAGCIVAHCAGHADAYEAGLALLLGGLCQQGADCPTEADVQGMLAPEVTCETPGLDTLGHDEPFISLCEGTVGVTAAQVTEACELLATCPGAEWLGGVAGCSAFLVVAPSAAQRTQCLLDAVDCTGAYACLEGL